MGDFKEQEDELKLMKRKFLHKILPMRKARRTDIIRYASETSGKDGGLFLPVVIPPPPSPPPPPLEQELYRSYPERWWLLGTVVLLNLANYSHWVAFPSVMKMTAQYYDQDGDTMDLIPTVSYGLGVPCCLVATFVVEKFGLRVGLHIGGALTGLGGLLCFLSSLPYVSDEWSNDAKFYMALVGQALTGVACPFISCVPTKISQHWFGDEQRTVATILLGMSNPMGIVLGQGITPLLVRRPEDVPIMNIVWFIPAAIGAILAMWKVTADLPPAPPSPSAAMQHVTQKRYLPSIKKLLTNKAYLIMFLFVGGAMGYISCLSTKFEQILCAQGYSDQLSGLSGSLILLIGFIASFPFGIIAYKTGRLILICKLCGVMCILSMILLAYFMRVPNMGVAIACASALLGMFSLGCYPLALELVVECTYPVDQAIGTAFIFLSSSLQGVLLMQAENYFGSPLSADEMLVQSCVNPDDPGHQQPKDYSHYLYFITSYMSFFILCFICFFNTEMKRTQADDQSRASTKGSSSPLAEESGISAAGLQQQDPEGAQDATETNFLTGKQRGP